MAVGAKWLGGLEADRAALGIGGRQRGGGGDVFGVKIEAHAGGIQRRAVALVIDFDERATVKRQQCALCGHWLRQSASCASLPP